MTILLRYVENEAKTGNIVDFQSVKDNTFTLRE